MWNSQYTSDYLMHHGILGMKWGIRRYQNEDGSLTPAGKLRYKQNEDGTYRKTTKEERAKERDRQRKQADLQKRQNSYDTKVYEMMTNPEVIREAESLVNEKLDKWTDEYAKSHGGKRSLDTMKYQEAWFEKAMEVNSDIYDKLIEQKLGKRPE